MGMVFLPFESTISYLLILDVCMEWVGFFYHCFQRFRTFFARCLALIVLCFAR